MVSQDKHGIKACDPGEQTYSCHVPGRGICQREGPPNVPCRSQGTQPACPLLLCGSLGRRALPLTIYLRMHSLTNPGHPKSKYQHSPGQLAVPTGGTGRARPVLTQSVSTTSSPSLFSSPSESSSPLYRYISPSATECLSSVPSPSSLRLQVLTMTGMLGSRLWGT